MSELRVQDLPVGTSSFEKLRLCNQLFVDKTALIFNFASSTGCFFLTRPRRFGKSLLVSTLASLFANGLKHFHGLAIESLWKDRTYCVVELDFLKIRNFSDIDSFEKRLKSLIVRSFARAGFTLDRSEEDEWLDQLSDWMSDQPSCSLVVLIDEYDAPLTASLEDASLFEVVRKRLADFYALLKTNDDCLRFVFMTGITKFSQTGIFSELNNFTDISLMPEFGSLLGYSEEDIELYFSSFIENAAKKLTLPVETLRTKLRENYDGYCFERSATVRVYAPWSVLNFFRWPEQGFVNYWIESGGNITLLQQYLHSHVLKSPTEYAEEKTLELQQLSTASDLNGINDIALLMQTGYLTIRGKEGNVYRLSYPNREVTEAMAILYSNMLLGARKLPDSSGFDLSRCLREGDVESLLSAANRVFAAIDYAQYPIKSEKDCQTFLQLFIAGMGFDVVAERHGALGRSDLEVDAGTCHWVFEIKYAAPDGMSETALLEKACRQIRERNYGATARRPLVRVALVFSSDRRAFTRWKALP